MTLTREQLTQRIEKLGGSVKSSVSRKTDLLIVGEGPGETKLSAAHDKGVPTLWWSLGEWLGLFSERDGPGWKSIDPEITTTLSCLMSSITEDLYAQWSEDNSSRHYNAFAHASSAVMILLTLSWGIRKDDRPGLLPLPEEYLTVRNGRDKRQLLEDSKLVLSILQELVRVEDKAKNILGFWITVMEELD